MASISASRVRGEDMVNDSGQLYTIEGLSAAILMIVTAYIMLSTTTLFTPGGAHVVDLQLEQLGNDALTMMDTPDSAPSPSFLPFKSNLSKYIENGTAVGNRGGPYFKENLTDYIRAKTNGQQDTNLQFTANVTYSTGSVIGSVPFASSDQTMTGREHAVKVSRLVLVKTPLPNPPLPVGFADDNPHYVLIEVTLWRA